MSCAILVVPSLAVRWVCLEGFSTFWEVERVVELPEETTLGVLGLA
jgi:hypothetical protein